MLQSIKRYYTDWPTPMGGWRGCLWGPAPKLGLCNIPTLTLGVMTRPLKSTEQQEIIVIPVVMHKSAEDGDIIVAEETGG